MRQFHKPTDEKRMAVILPQKRYQDWLETKPESSMEFMQMFPAGELKAEAVVSSITETTLKKT